jgi:hypothetical protein
MTTDELIAFWSRLGRHTVHPDDEQALLERSGFETRLLPLPWNGPIRSARAFVAFLNPGLDTKDVPYEQGNSRFCERLRENLDGRRPYVYFDPAYLNHPGATWARETFGPDWPSSYADRICVIQLVAYHSSDNAAPEKVSHRLQSTSHMKAWVKETLLQRVRSGEALLVVGRGVSRFNLDDEQETENFVRYRFPENRRAHMTKKTRGGDALRRFLGLPRSS